jgi:hypothetical protein
MRRLKLAFSTPADLASEVARNIGNGGVQLHSLEPFELRELVEVVFEFAWSREALAFEGEVVFFSAEGNVAVELTKPVSEIRADLAPFLGRSAPRSAPPAKPTKPAAPPPSLMRADSFDPDDDLDIGIDPNDLDPVDLDLGELPPPDADDFVDPNESTMVRAPQPADPLANVADRRKSPRAVVRVPARVQSSHVSFEGRTRDLSETGVLISGDATDLPLGKTVQLELQHPVSGRRMEARGVVSRHVETEGAVAAVGIHFEAPADEEILLKEFVSDVKRAEAERIASGITGRIEELGMPSLLQMLGQSSPHGTLTATNGPEEATVAFEHGAIRYAQLGNLMGIKAIARMLQWPSGAFSFHAYVDPITDEPDPIPLQNALIEAARQVDEARAAAPLDMRARFTVNRAAFADAGELSKTEEAVLDLAAANMTVRRILDVIPEPDAEVQYAIRALLEREMLVPK